jgi:selenocysteine lyase/cysteine desulfurase
MNQYSLEYIKSQIIGDNLLFDTPFGERHLFYADYTASGRGLKFIEEKIQNILKSYANTHTEDDYTGKYMTTLLHQAEEIIKKRVNAGDKDKIISIGSGTTAALLKLQQILGIYLPPATKDRLQKAMEASKGSEENLVERVWSQRPIIFISPYEHHTNELMWRESFAETVVVKLDETGMLDLEDLEKKLSVESYNDRVKLASFSAGSNITGLRTRVYDVAKICHQHQVPILFDFAAIAPYVDIDMNKDEESYFDAIFFSPHKFLGGPGTSGVLIFNENLYRSDLPPTAAGGGTVDYVGYRFHDFYKDIETREKAGTPPILQTIKTALVMDLKEKTGIKQIEEIEADFARLFLDRLGEMENVEQVGTFPTEYRIPIISFNIKHKDRYLHPKFVTKLLNDLFGLQSRAGCSCAGPYGHFLLGIDEEQSAVFRKLISEGYHGIKPGWVRVNLHYTFDEKDLAFLLDCVNFVANYGHLFLKKYRFNMTTAEWSHVGFIEENRPFTLDDDFQVKEIDKSRLEKIRKSYFEEALQEVDTLEKEPGLNFQIDTDKVERVKFFYYVKSDS